MKSAHCELCPSGPLNEPVWQNERGVWPQPLKLATTIPWRDARLPDFLADHGFTRCLPRCKATIQVGNV